MKSLTLNSDLFVNCLQFILLSVKLAFIKRMLSTLISCHGYPSLSDMTRDLFFSFSLLSHWKLILQLLLKLHDNRLIETVGIPVEGDKGSVRLTACVSSQVFH